MQYVAVLVPSIVVGLLFWFAMRAIFRADRSEREALARAELEAAQKEQGTPQTPFEN